VRGPAGSFAVTGAGPLHADELAPKTVEPIAKADIPKARSKETRGWEVPCDQNEKIAATAYVVGSWMTKHRARYYRHAARVLAQSVAASSSVTYSARL